VDETSDQDRSASKTGPTLFRVKGRQDPRDVAAAFAALLMGGYAILTRSPSDLLFYPLRFGGIFAGIAVAVLWAVWFIKRSQTGATSHTHLQFLVVTLGVSALIVGAAVVYYGGAVVLIDLIRWMQNPSGLGEKGQVMAVTAVSTLVIGVVLFFFRLRLRFVYGITEAFIGIVVAVQRVSSEPTAGFPTEAGFYLAVLTAGIYLVVRGLDNAYQGLRDPDDPIGKRFVALIHSFANPSPKVRVVRRVGAESKC
jgi:hypothetical protein